MNLAYKQRLAALAVLFLGALHIPANASAQQAGDVCLPDCREGYVCVQGQCVSACNPPCDDGEVCTGEAMCVARPGVKTTAPEKTSEKVSRNAFSAGVAIEYLQPIYTALAAGETDGTPNDEIFAIGTAASVHGVFALEFGPVGFRFTGGRILNGSGYESDIHLGFGPTLTASLGEYFLLGGELTVDFFNYDISGSLGGVDSFEVDPDGNVDMESDVMIALGAALRMGLKLPISEQVAIVPELRLHSTFFSPIKDGVAIWHYNDSGCCERNPADRVFIPGATFGVYSRLSF